LFESLETKTPNAKEARSANTLMTDYILGNSNWGTSQKHQAAERTQLLAITILLVV
jgi:hypothetical protein